MVEALSVIDYGDAPTVPGYHEETLKRIEAHLRPVREAGVIPLCLGGDHSIVLAELRAAASVHGGPLALVHLDAHADVWEQYYGARYFHGPSSSARWRRASWTPRARCRRACGARSTAPPTSRPSARSATTRCLIGARAPDPRGVRRARARPGGNARAFLSFDIDFVDPAFAPGTGTLEVGGPTVARRPWPTCAR